MHLSKLLKAIALCVCAISAQAQAANYDLWFQSEFKIMPTDTHHTVKALKEESTGTYDGRPLILQHRWKSHILKTMTEGKKSTTQNQLVAYSYRLVLTPEKLAPGQFEESHDVQTQIKLEQFVEGQDGQSSPQTIVKDVAMAVGEQTNLDWSINGEKYQLTLRLISAKALKR
ncbi:hypothetical protein [Pseudomonas sp. G5(2012)]|uniref:hypothetical protein n=1 Tax=Pseudomonas sp. G5(2012) TaxID=1268068 RepID=UPI000343159E|nr:hypothetical protein [Pseudomonas sp. G5(2012)]EPA99435.1 hypothetical protein PG5_02420 [Pseudomonas sp. G5(2012)]